jgi:hypothetical protein
MARKRKTKVVEPTREQRVTQIVNDILSAEAITPVQLYDLLLMGHRVYKQGVGIPECAVLDAILKAFAQHDRHYMNPYVMAQLRGEQNGPAETDFETLRDA